MPRAMYENQAMPHTVLLISAIRSKQQSPTHNKCEVYSALRYFSSQ